MSNLHLNAFAFFRMWPRNFFDKKEGDTGRLLLKREVPELQLPGVYVLYKGDELYYVGRAAKLWTRLHAHSNMVTDDYYAHWDYFSAFALVDAGTDSDQQIAQLEAILIAAMPRATNKATPRFKRVPIPRALRADASDK